MRRTRIALLASVLMLGATALQAQTAHTDTCDSCGGQSCQSGCSTCGNCGSCGSGCGMLSGVKAGLYHALSGIGIACDARHGIYKAALRRNTFDKKFLLPIPYMTHVLPMYRHNRCCTGCANTKCPTCGPQQGTGDGMHEIYEGEIYEGSEGMPFEPTPAAAPARQVVSGAVLHSQEARIRRSRPKRAMTRDARDKSADRVARQDSTNVIATPTLRTFAPVVIGPENRARSATIRQVSAVRERAAADPANPLR